MPSAALHRGARTRSPQGGAHAGAASSDDAPPDPIQALFAALAQLDTTVDKLASAVHRLQLAMQAEQRASLAVDATAAPALAVDAVATSDAAALVDTTTLAPSLGTLTLATAATTQPSQPAAVLALTDTSLPPVALSSAGQLLPGRSVVPLSVSTPAQCAVLPSMMAKAAQHLPALNHEVAVRLAISEPAIASTYQCQRMRVLTEHGQLDIVPPSVARAICPLEAISPINGCKLASYTDTGANVSSTTSAAATASGLQVRSSSLTRRRPRPTSGWPSTQPTGSRRRHPFHGRRPRWRARH